MAMRTRWPRLLHRSSALWYAALLAAAWHAGRSGSWVEATITLLAFGIAASLVVAERRRFDRRLAHLVDLFARAERGDFSADLQTEPGEPHDALALLGRAYDHLRRELAPLVLTDPLTGCMNRRGFEQELTRAAARAARNETDLALLALDVDHFKRANDGYGHLAGDAVLREVGALLRHAARAGDVVARLGGDEFVLVLPDCDSEEAGVVAERVTELMRGHVFRTSRGDVRVTLSVGIATEAVHQPAVAASLRARADEALYVAKRLGRDRVVLWAPGISSRATPPYVTLVSVLEPHREPDVPRAR